MPAFPLFREFRREQGVKGKLGGETRYEKALCPMLESYNSVGLVRLPEQRRDNKICHLGEKVLL